MPYGENRFDLLLVRALSRCVCTRPRASAVREEDIAKAALDVPEKVRDKMRCGLEAARTRHERAGIIEKRRGARPDQQQPAIDALLTGIGKPKLW
jgi:hypothetical protein